MTQVVKCSACNIVIDELLCYIQDKVSIADEETLVRICTSSFSSEEIKNAKSLLFESIPTDVRKIHRKNKGKEGREVGDIINLFKSTEPDIMPIFVAKNLNKLPPISFDHLDCSKLLKDMMKIRADVEIIKSTYATIDSIQALETEINLIKTNSLPPTLALKVNTKRGAWLDSGPMGLSNDDFNNLSNDNHAINENNSLEAESFLRYRSLRVDEDNIQRDLNERQRSIERAQTSEVAARGAGGSPSTASDEASAQTGSAQVTSDSHSGTSNDKAARKQGERSSMQQTTSTRNESENDGWQEITYRKKQKKYRYVGKSGIARDSECTFRAADVKLPMFITNVHMSTREKDIVDYIFKKTKETVYLEKINMKVERGHKAYKFFISEANLPMYMDEAMWPAGVIFRRFVSFTQRKKLETGQDKPHNG
ncbi:uncharacterized protein LOC128670559 [Plodia interpunctella]|uniref:uncharacterized protein LOC128670559 n=1 Tax=Plodia interpunctella TaxID=58824 RepID=UPI00236760FB|nr:uncharacterized protein LOC128670559 [Plodia interpunctella]XP_053624091.1 uncharacterized protein LOC128683003 [Plodia interpunctella]